MGARLAPRSARRTWSIDVTFPSGLAGDVVADIRGRDLRTDGTGTASTIDELVVRIDIDAATRTISAVAVERGPGTLVDLDGISTRAGFARHLAELFPGDGCAPDAVLQRTGRPEWCAPGFRLRVLARGAHRGARDGRARREHAS